MRQATILIVVLAAVGCVADDDDTDLSASEEAENTVAPTHDPTGPNCPGGSGGGDSSGGPGDQPKRKKCSRDQGLEQCLDCCFYNHDKVDGWKCRRIKGDSPRQRAKREKCGRDRPIITITATGELP
jgi:hypothetical protein